MRYIRRVVTVESKAVKRIFSLLYACALTSYRIMVTRIGDQYGSMDAVVLSECGEVTRISAEAAM